MRVVEMPRGAGKTQYLLDWLQKAPDGEHRVLVSHSKEESHRVQRVGMHRGLESWQFVSAHELIERGQPWDALLRARGGQVVLGIDNLDLFLAAVLRRRVDIATYTR
jgi:hypothetical protein